TDSSLGTWSIKIPFKRVSKWLSVFFHSTNSAGEQAPWLLGPKPVAYEDNKHRPSTITHKLPKPNTSMGTKELLTKCATCLIDSTRGITARLILNCSAKKLTAAALVAEP